MGSGSGVEIVDPAPCALLGRDRIYPYIPFERLHLLSVALTPGMWNEVIGEARQGAEREDELCNSQRDDLGSAF